LGQHAEKPAREWIELGPIRDCRDSLALFDPGQDRAGDEAAKFGAFGEKAAKAVEVLGDRIERMLGIGQFIQRGRITASHASPACGYGCHLFRTLGFP
jgi:hypothetical protein